MTSKTSVHRSRGMYLRLDHEISDWAEGGNLLLGRRNSGHFHYKLIHGCVRFYHFSTKETTFWRKADNFAYFSMCIEKAYCVIISVIVMCIYQLFRYPGPEVSLDFSPHERVAREP